MFLSQAVYVLEPLHLLVKKARSKCQTRQGGRKTHWQHGSKIEGEEDSVAAASYFSHRSANTSMTGSYL